MIITRIKFYSDCPDGKKNKFFCYSCNELELHEFFTRQFQKGYRIRAAYFERKTSPGNIVIDNIRFSQASLQYFFDYSVASPFEQARMKPISFYNKYIAHFNELWPNLK